MALLSSNVYRYFASTLYSLQAVVVIVIFLIELKTMYCALSDEKTQIEISTAVSAESPRTPSPSEPGSTNIEQSTSKLISMLPMLSYLFYIMTAIFGALTVLGVDPCVLFAYAGPSCYIMAKMFMYSVFVYRLYIVYSDSIFAYNNKILLILFIFIVGNALFTLVWNILTLDVNIVYYDNNSKTCSVVASTAIYVVSILFDFIITTLCCYLFVKPLLILNGTLEHKQDELRKLVLKYMILTFVAVTTTFLFILLMGITKLMALIAIDSILTCICIALFNKFHDYYFQIICCGIISVCNHLCHSKQTKNKNNTSTKSQSSSIV